MSQPQRSSGMIAHVGKPGTLDDALNRIMVNDDPASPIPEEPVSATDPNVETTVETSNVRPITRRSRGEKAAAGVSILGELTALQKMRRNKVTLNTRIDDWIDDAINKTLRDLEANGYTNVTKEAIVIQSLIRGLNLTPPEGWEAL
jgi:hypothetical protein